MKQTDSLPPPTASGHPSHLREQARRPPRQRRRGSARGRACADMARNAARIPVEVQEKMFNPFFTTKPAGEGTGLGLSMTHDIIVKQHGGRIDVATEPGHFTEFILILPRNLSGRDRGET